MPEGTVLGFDYGMKRIGVAVGQRLTRTASPVAVLKHSAAGIPWPRIDALIDVWRPSTLVVGVPIDEEGGEQPMTRHARRFAGQLGERTRLPTHHADERYSSIEADERFRELRRKGGARRKNSSNQDAVAAQLILERWLDG